MPPFPEINLQAAVNVLYTVYYFIRQVVTYMLEVTVFRANPGAAPLYADAVTLLTVLTLLYLALELFTSAKRIVAILLLVGWALLILSIALGQMFP
ncbi:MAG: hypothetical protein QW057_08775 [Candidatus Bathyarchaeia archaeon]